jgi:SPP1 family predicted phage head-tail adaptor
MSAPGLLDQRVTFRRPVRASDGGGGATVTMTDVATVWARVVPETAGGERFEADRVEAGQTYTVTIRNGALGSAGRAVDTEWVLIWTSNGGLALNPVQAADPGPRALWRHLVCEAGRAV